MKCFELTKEENKILKDYETGKPISIGDLDKKRKLYQSYAKNTLAKARNINIRVSQKDLLKLKAKSVTTGIPYQTLATSVLHKFVNDKD